MEVPKSFYFWNTDLRRSKAMRNQHPREVLKRFWKQHLSKCAAAEHEKRVELVHIETVGRQAGCRQICDGQSLQVQQVATAFNQRLATNSKAITYAPRNFNSLQ